MQIPPKVPIRKRKMQRGRTFVNWSWKRKIRDVPLPPYLGSFLLILTYKTRLDIEAPPMMPSITSNPKRGIKNRTTMGTIIISKIAINTNKELFLEGFSKDSSSTSVLGAFFSKASFNEWKHIKENINDEKNTIKTE